MFNRNDYALFAARILLIIFFYVGIIASLVIGILCAVKIHWAFFLLIFAGWIATCISWIFARLMLSFFCDVKLIRNKLYIEENKKLEVFFKSKKDSVVKENEESVKNENVELEDNIIEESNSEENAEEESKTNKDKLNVISIIIASAVGVVIIVTVLIVRILI